MDFDTELSPNNNFDKKSFNSRQKIRANQVLSLSSKEVVTKDKTNSEVIKSSMNSHF